MLQVPDKRTKALLELADFLETLDPDLYDQTDFDGCICGWCNKLKGRAIGDTKAASKDLGLNVVESAALFHQKAGQRKAWFGGMIAPTNRDAARTLRHLATTGDIPDNW